MESERSVVDSKLLHDLTGKIVHVMFVLDKIFLISKFM